MGAVTLKLHEVKDIAYNIRQHISRYSRYCLMPRALDEMNIWYVHLVVKAAANYLWKHTCQAIT